MIGDTVMMRLLKRVGNVIEGLVFLVLSVCLQSLFFLLVSMAVLAGLAALGLNVESRILQWTVFGLLLVATDALACWEYFYKNRATVRLGKTSSVIFMVPRAFDLIWNGSARINR